METQQKSINERFPDVISMIEKGWTISESLDKLNIVKTSFYRKITKDQKCLLDIARTTNTKYGIGTRGSSYRRTVKYDFIKLDEYEI